MNKITAGTVSRFVLLFLALINAGLEMVDLSVIPVNEAGVSEFISLVFLGGTALWSYWKNNDVTKKAREEQK